MKYILLSFDLEEFDLPREFNIEINDEEMYKISYEGCNNLLKILNVKSTFFVTANFARKYPKLIKKLSKKNEIGLHGDEHKDNYLKLSEEEVFIKLKKSKETIEKIISKKIKGFRAPRLQFDKYNVLKKLNFEYDSSYIPSYAPGRYNNLFGKRKIFIKDGIKVIPISVIPICRLPLAWYALRNSGLWYWKLGTIFNEEICLDFHPWEFIDIRKYNIPFLFKRNTGKYLELKLENYIKWCLKKNYNFVTFSDYLSQN